MEHITKRGTWWSVAAVGCMLFVVSARVVLPAQAVSSSDHGSAASPAGGDLNSMQIDHVPVAAVPGPALPMAAVLGGGQPALAVSVPATAVIQADDDGRVVAAMTNTGQPPQPDDDLWLMNPDRSMQPTSASRFADQVWIGDFAQPGVYVAQTQ